MRVPVDVDVGSREVVVIEVDDDRIDAREPFFHLTVDRLLSGGGRTHRLSFDEVTAGAGDLGPPPDAVLLHTGRCGSSLLATGLRGLGWATLSEPLAVSAALTIEEPEVRRRLVDAIVRLLVAAVASDGPTLLKLSARDLPRWAVLHELLPDAFTVGLWRDPVECVASYLAGPPPWRDVLFEPPPRQRALLGADAGLEPGQALASAAELYARAWRAAAQPFAGSKRPEVLLAYPEVVADLAGMLTDLDERVRPGRTADPALVADAAEAATAHNAKAATPQPYDPDGADRRPPLRPATAEQVQSITGATVDELTAALERAPKREGAR